MARKYSKKRKSFKKGKTKKRSSKSFDKKVGKIINKSKETKECYNTMTATGFNSGINSAADALQILPAMGSGTGEAQRIGNEVNALSFTIKGAIVYNPSTGVGGYSNARLGVRMMIVQPKAYSSYDVAIANATTWMSQLLRKGLTQTNFLGNLDDLWAPINTDAITCYYNKVFYMQGPVQYTGAGFFTMPGSTKMFSKTFRFKGSGKRLRYDPDFNSSILPTNYAPILILGYTHMDGSAADTISTAVQLNYTSYLNYKDS